jgi:hypothetical protein
MRSQSVPQRSKEEEIGRLLAQLRRQVAQLHRLEQASRAESELRTSRQTIEELHWRLARLAGNHSTGGHSVADRSEGERMSVSGNTRGSDGGGR